MCGIAGIISGRANAVDAVTLQRMGHTIRHRGPDGENIWLSNDQCAGLLHERLAVIDLSCAAAQPMHYHSRYTIVYNGEIYNYIELREALLKKGYNFHTGSDTEVLLAAFDCYGHNCVDYLDGMFAFAVWDHTTRQLFAARDRFGEKPFYYAFEQGVLYFASEMKALWAAGIARQVNPTMLLNYLTLGIVQHPVEGGTTFFKGIHKLPVASTLTFDTPTGSLNIQRYWDIDANSIAHINETDALEQFTTLFKRSVARRLRSDVAVGTSLSGGLDSSAIVATLHQLQAGQLQTFSAVFPGFEKDESAFIRQVTNSFGLPAHFVTPTAEGFAADFENMLLHQEEPVQSASLYAQYKVYQLARQHNVTVLLDGQGADEVLAGYHKYYHWYWQQLLREKGFKAAQQEIQAARALGVNQPWGFANYVAAYMPSLAASRLQHKAYRQQTSHPFLQKDFVQHSIDKTSLYKPAVSNLNQLLYFNTMQLGLEELLRYSDKNAMCHGREVRLPFLSHELVQFIFSLPAHYKIRKGYTKFILRQGMQGKLPDSIVWRKDKTGFEPPQKQWMQHPHIQQMMVQARQKLTGAGVLNPAVLNTPINPLNAHDAHNYDWRYLCAAYLF
jgi:asparagine synthase (glutamine-hydrolysing)